MSRKKLLIVATTPETFTSILRGQPSHLSELFEVHIITSPDQGESLIKKYESISPIHVKMIRGISPLRDILSIFLMIAALIKIKPDAIHSYTPKAGLVSMLAAWCCRIPVRIHTFTGLIFPTQTGIKQKLLILIDRLICACATTVIPEGNGVKSDLINYRITNKPLNIIGHGNIAGVDTGFFSPQAAKFPAPIALTTDKPTTFIFCFVGRINRDKGIYELVTAFSRLPTNAHLLIAGDLDQSAPPTPRTLEQLHANPRIHLLGYQHDIRPTLMSAQILVLPSYREGFPNVILQAGAMHLPVIASDINGCNEIIDPGKNGWLVPPMDSESLHKTMLQSMNTPLDELKAMGVRARLCIENKFERRDHLHRMMEFYKAKLGCEAALDLPPRSTNATFIPE